MGGSLRVVTLAERSNEFVVREGTSNLPDSCMDVRDAKRRERESE